MNTIECEVEEVKKLCENVVPNSKVIACIASSPTTALVRVDIKENADYRQLTACLRFPENYPNQTVLVELKSRTLSSKFLDGLTTLAEAKAREHHGRPQCLHVLTFLQQFLKANPLCVCVDEIQQLRKDLGGDCEPDQLKLKQKTSTVYFTAKGGDYYYRLRAVIPESYPRQCVELHDPETNLPAILQRYLSGQSREIARQCVEAPLRAKAGADFQPQPSLYRALKFCLEATRDFHIEICPICLKTVLPADPAQIELDDSKDSFVERVYCGHLFHQGCLRHYLQEPPFPKGGKQCPSKKRHPRSDARSYLVSAVPKADSNNDGDTCGIRLAHDRWVVNVKLAEARWAQKQARHRELQEVIDFMK